MLRSMLILLACASLGHLDRSTPAAERPNIVVVLADDLGYGDLHCYGNEEVHTPHLDRCAKEGLKFAACYAAAPNCSPSRTGLMTGRTPYRVGIHNWIPMLAPMHVSSREITVATLLRDVGYTTCHVGKWHLNGRFNLDGQPQPNDHGFDHWFSTQNNALPNHHNPVNFVRNGEPVGKLEGYAAHLVIDEAIRWLDDRRKKADDETNVGEVEPFFLFVCFHEPHEPIASDPQYAKLYESDDPSYAAHHGNVTQMDAAFGRLTAALDERGLRDDTLVLFTSDNGPAITRMHPHGSAGPLRDKKGSVYEGGIRVPGLLRWPGYTKPGTTTDEPICGVDLLPTLCEISGAEIPADRTIDGTSWVPVLAGKPIGRKTPLYWQFNRATGRPKVALRDGRWKIVATLTGPNLGGAIDIRLEETRTIKTAELDTFELYDLAEDVGEQHDLAATHPEKLAELRRRLEPLYRDVRNETPLWPDWISPRYESKRIEWPEYWLRKRGG